MKYAKPYNYDGSRTDTFSADIEQFLDGPALREEQDHLNNVNNHGGSSKEPEEDGSPRIVYRVALDAYYKYHHCDFAESDRDQSQREVDPAVHNCKISLSRCQVGHALSQSLNSAESEHHHTSQSNNLVAEYYAVNRGILVNQTVVLTNVAIAR